MRRENSGSHRVTADRDVLMTLVLFRGLIENTNALAVPAVPEDDPPVPTDARRSGSRSILGAAT
jgi:hypothetical protein